MINTILKNLEQSDEVYKQVDFAAKQILAFEKLQLQQILHQHFGCSRIVSNMEKDCYTVHFRWKNLITIQNSIYNANKSQNDISARRLNQKFGFINFI